MGARLREYLKGNKISSAEKLLRDTRGANILYDKDMKAIINKLDKLYKYAPEFQRKEILKKSAVPLVEAASQKAPKSESNKPRSVKHGEGATSRKIDYYPGNLKRSIRVLNIKKSKDVFVGPKVIWNPKAAAYGKNRKTVNAYYAHWVEYGNRHMNAQPYMRPAWDATRPLVLKILKNEIEATLKKWIKQNRPTHTR